MDEGTIVRWLKKDGDLVSQGEPLAEVETDKATVTFDADADGALRILAAEGETVPIGGVIGSIGDVPEPRPGSPDPAQAALAAPAPAAAGKSSDASDTGNGVDRVRASPLARRIARESRVDLTGVTGSGPGGRIVKADLEGVAKPAPGPARLEQVVPGAAAAQARGAKGVVTTQQPSRTQVQIAQRMSESKATIPDFTLHTEADMEQAVELRAQLRRAGRGGDALPSYNDMVVKACALALRDHPRANAAYRDGAFELYERVNVGVAVAVEDSLIVPTVFDADRKSLLDIAREARTLAERVRTRQVTPAELSGATFTVSNLGMYGVASFAAIINPPQAAILAVGELREVPVVRDGQVVPGSRMSLVLTCDHRILYGAPAAEFLARVRQLLEQPLYLLV
jgi:pyruvate dehydrogenase E2 component (dihydrolipoamide acetyltransferase)